MAYFPMFIDIEKKKCLVAGGGTVALRKVRVLLDFGAQITVVAPQIDPQILQLTGNVCVKERTFEPEDLKECVLVVAATDDVTENHRIARMAQKKHIPVNAVDQQEDCSFIFPSYLKHRDLVGAFSSAGWADGNGNHRWIGADGSCPCHGNNVWPMILIRHTDHHSRHRI